MDVDDVDDDMYDIFIVQRQRHAPTSLSWDVNIENLEKVNPRLYAAQLKIAKRKLRINLRRKNDDDDSVSDKYDCDWLAMTIAEKLHQAQLANKNEFVLKHRCCSIPNCPVVVFMKAFIDAFRS